jgi:hypothetical protein
VKLFAVSVCSTSVHTETEARGEKMKAYLDEIGSPVGPIAFATDEEGALLGLAFRDGRRPASLDPSIRS